MKKPTPPVIAVLVSAMLFLFAAVCATPVSGKEKTAAPASSASTQDWQKEFDDICSKTQDTMIFTVEELQSLMKRCDALEPQIQQLDETRRKVFTRRLQQCRGLYAYVLESKKSDTKK